VVTEDIRQIPGLYLAWVEPGQSEPVLIGERIIPEAFTTFYHFKDKSKTWRIEFNIRIIDGTPLLNKVTTIGSHLIDMAEADTVTRWQLKIAEQYRYQLLELGVELAITTRWPTVMLRKEYNAENMAVSRAMTDLGHKPNQIVLDHPSTITGTLPNGEPADFVRFWDGNPNPIEGKALKALQRDIGKSVRKRITNSFLKEVAGVYEQAVADGLNPHDQIMAIYKCAHRTAQAWATKARQLNYLLPTTPGKITVKTTKRKGKK
jgi:hypothetical protein